MILRRIAIFILALFLLGCSSGLQKEAGILVTANWLQDRIDVPGMLLLHVGTEEMYDSIHIPGAHFLDPYGFTVEDEDNRNELPTVDSIGKLLQGVGIGPDSRIVLYYEDEDMITRTARVFMTLDYVGLGDRTHVLNGGLTGWMEAALPHDGGLRPVTGDVGHRPVTSDGGLRPVTSDIREVVMLAHDLNQERWNPEYVVIDCRSSEEYYGEVDSTGQDASGGHIEGAYFMSYGNLLSETDPHIFLEDDALRKEFEKAGMNRAKTAVYYCRSGVRASVNYMVARHLGYPALLYDGSIQEWESLALPMTSPVINPDENR